MDKANEDRSTQTVLEDQMVKWAEGAAGLTTCEASIPAKSAYAQISLAFSMAHIAISLRRIADAQDTLIGWQRVLRTVPPIVPDKEAKTDEERKG